VSEPGEPEIDVPPQLAGGAFANDVYVYDDPEHVTIDFVRLDPRDPGTGVVVARVCAPPSCILRLEEHLSRRSR